MMMWEGFAYTKNTIMDCDLGIRQVSMQSLTIVEMFGIFNIRGVYDQNHLLENNLEACLLWVLMP